jgi:1,4-dihydroxy-2-naphthoyl-CoA synthase
MSALFNTILKHVPAQKGDPSAPLQLQISALDFSTFVGRIGVGRISQGTVKPMMDVVVMEGVDGKPVKGRVNQVLTFQGLERVQAAEAGPGDIVLINGITDVGIGVTMTLPMDIRIAADTAKFGFVFTRRGIVPEACSSWFLPRIVGIQQAQEWVFTGRVFSAAEALAGGLVRSIHPADELMNVARGLAREIADNAAPVSVALSRQMMWRMLGASHPMEAHRVDSRGIQIRGRSEDVREGVTSFLEKRPAQFTGKVSTDLPDIFPGWEEPEFF